MNFLGFLTFKFLKGCSYIMSRSSKVISFSAVLWFSETFLLLVITKYYLSDSLNLFLISSISKIALEPLSSMGSSSSCSSLSSSFSSSPPFTCYFFFFFLSFFFWFYSCFLLSMILSFDSNKSTNGVHNTCL